MSTAFPGGSAKYRTAPGRDDRKRWLALLLVCAAQLMIVLDGTIVNVALPAIEDDLGFSRAALSPGWSTPTF